MQLTAEQVQQYETDGYLFFEGLFTPGECELLREHAFSDRMERWRGAKHAGGFALTVSGAEKQGSSGHLLDEQGNLCELTRGQPSGVINMVGIAGL